MQITHEEAHRLIQFHADEALDAQEKIRLSMHLADCLDCRAYAQEIKRIEGILLPLMQRQWNLQPPPHLIDAIRTKMNSKKNTSMILATRTVAIGAAFLAFIFSVWQFALSGQQKFNTAVGVPPIPTPSAQSTSTRITFQGCEGRSYTVQAGDTLESIAYQFYTSREEILAANNMSSETIHPAMELVIPICNFTPTGTINRATVTTTYTPSRRLTTTTPDG